MFPLGGAVFHPGTLLVQVPRGSLPRLQRIVVWALVHEAFIADPFLGGTDPGRVVVGRPGCRVVVGSHAPVAVHRSPYVRSMKTFFVSI